MCMVCTRMRAHTHTQNAQSKIEDGCMLKRLSATINLRLQIVTMTYEAFKQLYSLITIYIKFPTYGP